MVAGVRFFGFVVNPFALPALAKETRSNFGPGLRVDSRGNYGKSPKGAAYRLFVTVRIRNSGLAIPGKGSRAGATVREFGHLEQLVLSLARFWLWVSMTKSPTWNSFPNMNPDIGLLYRLHCKELFHHLMRIVKCQETAEDLVQESYLILARTASDIPIDYPRGFLYRTASNLAMDHLRHHKIVERHQETASLLGEAEQAGAETELADQQWRDLLQQTIVDLPPRCRDVFILHKVRGLSYREVASLLDISESAVEKHIIKGLLHCRIHLSEHFGRPARSK